MAKKPFFYRIHGHWGSGVDKPVFCSRKPESFKSLEFFGYRKVVEITTVSSF